MTLHQTLRLYVRLRQIEHFLHHCKRTSVVVVVAIVVAAVVVIIVIIIIILFIGQQRRWEKYVQKWNREMKYDISIAIAIAIAVVVAVAIGVWFWHFALFLSPVAVLYLSPSLSHVKIKIISSLSTGEDIILIFFVKMSPSLAILSISM